MFKRIYMLKIIDVIPMTEEVDPTTWTKTHPKNKNSIFGAFTCFNFCSNHEPACFENFETILKMFTRKFLWHYYRGLHFRVHRVWFCFNVCYAIPHERRRISNFDLETPLPEGNIIVAKKNWWWSSLNTLN